MKRLYNVFQCFSKDWSKMCTKNNNLKLLINISISPVNVLGMKSLIWSLMVWHFKGRHFKGRHFKVDISKVDISKVDTVQRPHYQSSTTDQYLNRSIYRMVYRLPNFSFKELNLFGISFHNWLNHSFSLIFFIPVFFLVNNPASPSKDFDDSFHDPYHFTPTHSFSFFFIICCTFDYALSMPFFITYWS